MFKNLSLGILSGAIIAGSMLPLVSNAVGIVDTGKFGDNSNATAGLTVGGVGGENDDSLISIVKNGVNWVLGLIGLIALIILLYGAFGMVTAAGDDAKYKNGFKILKQAAVGLLVIGVSWFIIGLVFTVIGSITGGGNAGNP